MTIRRHRSVRVNGRTFHVYKNEAKGMALVGHKAEYQHYRELVRQERSSEAHHNMLMADAADTAKLARRRELGLVAVTARKRRLSPLL